MTQWLSLVARSGNRFDAYAAAPSSTHTPTQANGRGLIVLPEVYNINSFARGVADRYAALGYTVLVPDLFWRQHPARHYEYDQPEAAREQGESIDVDAVVSDVGVAAEALRERLGERARVGVIGYCLGGRLAALAGVRERVDAVVSYYGVKLDAHLDELARSETPSLLLFGDADPWVPNETVDAVAHLTRENPRLTVHRYANAGHGFDRIGHPPYHASSAADARARVLQLFDATLA